MARSNFDECLEFVLRWEGGFSNHPKDPGGATNRGITLKTYRRHRPGATVEDLKNISDAEVKRIYKKDYWDKVSGDELPRGLDLLAFNGAVLSGPGRAVKVLQGCLGTVPDGKIGPKTLARASEAIADGRAPEVIECYVQRRREWMKQLRGGRLWRAFGRGWNRRLGALQARALLMAGEPVQVVEEQINVHQRAGVQTTSSGAVLAPLAAWMQTGGDSTKLASIAIIVGAVLLALVGVSRIMRARAMQEEVEML